MSSKERCEGKKKKQSSVLRLRTFTTSTTTSRGCTSYLFADYLFDVDTVSSIVCVFDVDTVPSIVCVFGVDSVPYYSRPRPVLMFCLKDAWTVRGAEDARPARHILSSRAFPVASLRMKTSFPPPKKEVRVFFLPFVPHHQPRQLVIVTVEHETRQA